MFTESWEVSNHKNTLKPAGRSISLHRLVGLNLFFIQVHRFTNRDQESRAVLSDFGLYIMHGERVGGAFLGKNCSSNIVWWRFSQEGHQTGQYVSVWSALDLYDTHPSFGMWLMKAFNINVVQFQCHCYSTAMCRLVQNKNVSCLFVVE